MLLITTHFEDWSQIVHDYRLWFLKVTLIQRFGVEEIIICVTIFEDFTVPISGDAKNVPNQKMRITLFVIFLGIIKNNVPA